MKALMIRQAVLDDAQALVDLFSQLGYPNEAPGVRQRLAVILADPRQAIYVAEADDSRAVIGWVHVLAVTYLESEPFAEIGGLVVDAACRRLGAGRSLMSAAEDWAHAMHLQAVRLRSNVIRHEAHAFYERLGYTNVKSQYTFHKPL